MAYHVRRQIREAVAARVTGLAATASRVFQSRVYPLEATDLPGLLISTKSESVAEMDLVANPLLERQLVMLVEAVAQATADLDDTLDEICRQVEVAIATSSVAQLGGAKAIVLESTEIELSSEGEQPIGRATMQYRATYYTRETAPDVAI